jgi:hypothetical protein
MRQLPRTACAYLVGCLIAAASVPAFASDTGFTIDLMAPATSCVGSKCPSDISLPELGGVANAADVQMTGTSSAVTLDNTVAEPIVCSEASVSGAAYGYGAVGPYQISPIFNNASPGGLFEFDSGGASVVDASLVSNNGIVFATSQANTTTVQVACYPISPLGVTTPRYANSTVSGDRVFYNAFDGGHLVGEPWVSINTVASPTTSGHLLGYVMQIHNASSAVDWHLSFGYDHALFGTASNGGFQPKWCILAKPQPGLVDTNGALCADSTSIHMITAADVQSATNSVYVYVQNFGSSAAVSSWATLPITFYPASGAVFSQPGVYAQRIDDKVAVAGSANVPVQNIGNIVCANDPASTSCTISDQDGNLLPASVTFKNQVSTGAVTIDPVAYVVDPAQDTSQPGVSLTTAPGTSVALGAPSNVSCVDPNGIFASSVSASNFTLSTSAQGARAFNFNFKSSGALFVPGTASCTATFSANGLSSTQSFNVTMQQLTVTHFVVTADATATAGSSANFTVTAKDGANNTVPSYTGTVAFTSSDAQAVLPASSPLTNGVGSFSGTLKTAGSQTFTATDTVSSTIHGTSNNVTVSAAAVATLAVDISTPAPVGFATVMHVNPHDQYGNSVTGYTGTLHFTSTDSAATLPPDGAFTNGFYNNVTFNTTGPQTVTATDTGTSSITGTSNSVNVTP